MTADVMFWPVDRWRSRSVCRRYEVVRQGPRFDRSWAAWFKPDPDGQRKELIEVFRTGTEDEMRRAAKEACRKHAGRFASAARAQGKNDE